MPWSTVADFHAIVSYDASQHANDLVRFDTKIANKWKGSVFTPVSAFSDDKISLEITERYRSAPPGVQKRYQEHALKAIQQAIANHQDLFVGVILGEAKAGRNYFENWGYEPTRLF